MSLRAQGGAERGLREGSVSDTQKFLKLLFTVDSSGVISWCGYTTSGWT